LPRGLEADSEREQDKLDRRFAILIAFPNTSITRPREAGAGCRACPCVRISQKPIGTFFGTIRF
jgi:hypothetical protein